ncbi:MAG: hypothetical protein M9915_05755 [Rhizobacter sp.]|nr:hypothetical protein [Burkholderiaceae bacterium]MCO5123228.1 hypothetical protein [Rhizobacter sp.]
MRHLAWLLVAGLACGGAQAVDVTARVSLLGTAAHPSQGDAGYDSGYNPPTADQQSGRLMLDDFSDSAEWSAHGIVGRQHYRGFAVPGLQSSDLFRYRPLAGAQVSSDGLYDTTVLAWEVDRAYYEWRFDRASVSLGRQPIDWGVGRFWQPLNVFGAFAPTALDTDFKPGIDAAVLSWYPSAFSSLAGVFSPGPADDASIPSSAAVHYSTRVGETSQLTIVGGRVIGNDQFGGALEGDWKGLGWRVEGLYTKWHDTGDRSLFWIAGVDYRLDDGTLLTLEVYDNSAGATREDQLPSTVLPLRFRYGLQQQMSRHLLGFGLQKELTPLLSLNYMLLGAMLKNDQGQREVSLLNQLNLIYSLANESDLLLSLAVGSGKGLTAAGQPQSEFGQLPPTVTLRWRYYF